MATDKWTDEWLIISKTIFRGTDTPMIIIIVYAIGPVLHSSTTVVDAAVIENF